MKARRFFAIVFMAFRIGRITCSDCRYRSSLSRLDLGDIPTTILHRSVDSENRLLQGLLTACYVYYCVMQYA